MKYLPFKILYLLLCLGLSNQVLAQSLVDDADLSISNEGNAGSFVETIKIISNSKKIFILTNNNQQLGPGDFISLALDNKLAARAVVAKNHQGQAGIKILKIYSMAQWSKLRRNLDVQIVKGDDSAFGKKPDAKTDVKAEGSKIKTEEDLFSSDVVSEDDLEQIDDNKNRHIKPDNIVALSGAYFDAKEIESKGGKVREPMFGISWAYQFTDNYFVEGLYGRALLNNFPADNTQTLINHFTLRLKYNLKGPSYTFFLPYIGYRNSSVSSPDAGNGDSTIQNAEEVDAIDALKKSGPIFGVTIMRRLVPGWFIKSDIGSDIINIGFAIEF